MIIDAHTHIFERAPGSPVAGAGVRRGFPRDAAFRLEALLDEMDRATVERAVLLQGPYYGEANAYVLDSVRRHPQRLLAAACVDPWEQGRDEITALLQGSPFRALKLECSEPTGLFGCHPAATLADPDLRWLWDLLADLGLVLTVDLGTPGSRSYQTGALRQIADEHPGLKIVVAHLGQPPRAGSGGHGLRTRWEEQIELGRLPNVWFDCAALPAYFADEGYPYPSAGRWLRVAMDRIGPGKVMWGSDIPGLLRHATYPQLVAMAGLHAAFLAPADRARFLSGTARRVYWNETAESAESVDEAGC